MQKFKIPTEIKKIVDNIDVSDSNYEKAIDRYESIANYIDDSNDNSSRIEIYIQGSFKLGTAIRPLTEEGSYDIDIVCNFVDLNREMQTQAMLKEEIGKIIQNYAKKQSFKRPAEESKRCWTLNYIDESNFHVDILPAVPYYDEENLEIAITDSTNPNYSIISKEWEISNPKGYAEWFNEMSQFSNYKEFMAKKYDANIEEIPSFKVKTPLQRIIQLLKRHAEVMFAENIEYKPSSIIITTLATKSYVEALYISNNFLSLLINTILKLHEGIEYKDSKPSVMNPVNNEEDLSIKWADEDYFREFARWIEQLRTDFNIHHTGMSNKERAFYIERSLHKNQNNSIGLDLDTLSHHEPPKWTVYNREQVRIKASFTQKGFTRNAINSGEALNKNGSLKFEAMANNIKNFKVYWQVTNTGKDAIEANGLRGDFYESTEKNNIRTESTSYVGRHYVEAFLIKDGLCYGKSDPFEVNIVEALTFGWLKRKN